jgi:hypothetical protein
MRLIFRKRKQCVKISTKKLNKRNARKMLNEITANLLKRKCRYYVINREVQEKLKKFLKQNKKNQKEQKDITS